ncbi:MAG: hypothetical protein IT267_04525 [Saprospiraceae bacterium]|nr:hypothetical protein [Saprospiraceae bacterium]
MAFIDKLKGIFVVMDQEKKDVNQSESSVRYDNDKAIEGNVQNLPSSQKSQKFIELLSNLLEKNNLPGYDYFEYKKALQSVSKLGTMDESLLFKTVYAAAQSMGVDAQQLISTARKYLEVLENERSNFMQAADNYLSQTLKVKSEEQKALEQSLTSNKSKMEQLQKELGEQEIKMQTLSKELDEVKLKVENNKNDFGTTYLGFVEEIKVDIQKMEQYLIKKG